MGLFIGGVVSGVAVGMLYSLLGFSVILLYKSTGVANFAVGILATVGVFIAYRARLQDVSLSVSLLLAVVGSAAVGAIVYAVAIRPNSSAGHLNLTIRTFGIYLLLLAVLNATWAAGQPFPFPSVFSTGAAFSIGEVLITWNTLGTLAVAVVLAGLFITFFRLTRTGLAFLALAEQPEVARLLGVKTGRLTLIAWMASTVVALTVGLVVAPSSQLSSDMMEPYLLIGFSAAVIGGLTSLSGVFATGLAVGILTNVASLYVNPDIGAGMIFLVLVAILVVKPGGLFGKTSVARL